MFKGSNVALVTPFKNDKLDDETYIKLIHFHINNGTNGLVPAGTSPLVPLSMWKWINFIYASSSRPLFLNGVIKATFDPLNINTYNIV